MDLDFSKFDQQAGKALIEAIRSLIEDYHNEEDKAFFEKTAADNINKLYELAKRHAPDAVKGTKSIVKEKPDGDLRRFVNGVIQRLTVLGEQVPDGDLEGIMFNTASDLQKALDIQDDQAMIKAAKEAVQPYLHWEKTIERNQELRFGHVYEDEKQPRRHAAEVVDELLDKLGEGKEEVKKSRRKKNSHRGEEKSKLNKQLIREVILKLNALLEKKLPAELQAILETTTMDLGEAMDLEGKAIEKQVSEAVESFRKWIPELIDTRDSRRAVTAINMLVNALGDDLFELTKDEEKRHEKSKKIMEELQEVEKDIEQCRAVIREHNKKKRESEGPKPKKTRYMQLRERLLSIANLIPDKLKENLEVQQETEAVLLSTHSKLIKVWGMNKLKAKLGEKAIKERFDAMEEKIEKEERKKIAEQWKKDLPSIEKVLPIVGKDKQTIKEAAIDVINNLKQAIVFYEEDPAKAAKYLKSHFEPHFIEKHLPKYVREALKL
ncbi:hypothetical protein [Fulvivirga kasyanovii]|uniref:Uncharacterized protein n=1 Tax=Fulvivirga kasyanovii TaxID=396812 RepID=A0ABW9RQ64_9BACT|nr:hypothetical protein [Fulvivirga kasyanovii]MTI26304.1 hypothetical protein [Fulvivirga kasyanovii]